MAYAKVSNCLVLTPFRLCSDHKGNPRMLSENIDLV